jgi:hypothetical protein
MSALTPVQELILNMYASQYDHAFQQNVSLLEQSNRLISMMNELRYNMQTIYLDATRQIHITPTNGITNSNCIRTGRATTGTTNFIFSDIATPVNTECPISLVAFEPSSQVAQINRCGHLFFRDELNQWLQSNTRCPMCRTSVHYIIDASNNIIQT